MPKKPKMKTFFAVPGGAVHIRGKELTRIEAMMRENTRSRPDQIEEIVNYYCTAHGLDLVTGEKLAGAAKRSAARRGGRKS